MYYGGHHHTPRPQRQSKTDYRARSEIEDLERRLDYLTLACSSMWDIIKEHTNLDEQQLIERMHTLDSADGQLDKKIKPAMRYCTKCERCLPNRALHCQYCETYNPYVSAFAGAQ